MTYLGHPSSLHQYEHISSRSLSLNSSLQKWQNQVRFLIRSCSLTILKHLSRTIKYSEDYLLLRNLKNLYNYMSITVPARSKAWTAFPARRLGSWIRILLGAWIICVYVYSVSVLSSAQVVPLRRADPPSKESYRLRKRSRNWKNAQVQQRAAEP
jgi:hypothetical protein